MAALKSLQNYAKKQSQPGDEQARFTKIYNNLVGSRYYVIQNLQEASAGFDAWSRFENEYIDSKCDEWIDYLDEGYGDKDDLWNDLFIADNNGLKTQLCTKTKYIKGSFKGGHIINSLVDKHGRIKAFGKWLYDLIDKGTKLIVVGGHSNWFLYFVDIFIQKLMEGEIVKMWLQFGKALCEPFEREYHKVPNGAMVDVVVTQTTDKDGKGTVQIETIQAMFPEEKDPFGMDNFEKESKAENENEGNPTTS